uniref:Small ribosomal subunit protein uS4c n=1 Tax=Rhipilia penicilloides TaxID=1979422 RepID=A0A2P0QHP3_9CHLO|nr:ribosomal protein S4 [Rhipilia penicilloides]ARO74280.1 ribosomal protein S4 [Rhipilia penicilloides]
MSRYSGPRLRLFKRLGPLPGFGQNIHQKYQKYQNANLQASKKTNKQKNKAYSLRLIEKQKLRYNYGLTEQNLANYVRKAQKHKNSTGEILLKNLEMRLDNIVFRCGFTSTLPAARQLITHGHVFLNGQKRTRPSLLCKPQDAITLHKKIPISSEKAFQSSFISFDATNHRAQIHQTLQRLPFNIQELLVIEYYSRRNG